MSNASQSAQPLAILRLLRPASVPYLTRVALGNKHVIDNSQGSFSSITRIQYTEERYRWVNCTRNVLWSKISGFTPDEAIHTNTVCVSGLPIQIYWARH